MDNVYGIADKSNDFDSFLTVLINLNIAASIFFKLFILKNQYGNQFYSRRKYLIFFLLL